MTKEKLSLKDALAQGYEHYLYAGQKFQALQDLAFITDEDFDKGDIELVNKEPYYPSSGLSEEIIRDMLAEQIWSNHHDESGDDTDCVPDAIREIPLDMFSPIIKAIDDKLGALPYYKSSGIKLVK